MKISEEMWRSNEELEEEEIVEKIKIRDWILFMKLRNT